jgi:hypothetical protein
MARFDHEACRGGEKEGYALIKGQIVSQYQRRDEE